MTDLLECYPDEYLKGNGDTCQLIDPGHGGMVDGVYTTAPKKMKDWGAFVFYEGVWNRIVAKYTAKHCYELGLNYKIIVTENEDIPLSVRTTRANEFAAMHPELKCYYHSIHGNAFGMDSASGIEVFTYHGESKSDLIATEYYNQLKTLKWKMRPDWSDGNPDKEAGFYVLRHTDMPAILTENGFYTNFDEAKKMASEIIQSKLGLLFAYAQQQVENYNIL
jgi:N-acetylmuramoyl-L-alanine amidase